MKKANLVLVHISVWTLYIAFAIMVYGYGNNPKAAIYETTVSYLLSATLFYLHAEWILPAFFEKKKFKVYILMLILLYAYSLGIKYFFALVFDPWLFHTPSSIVALPRMKVFLVFSFQWFNFTLYSTGYWLANRLIKIERQLREKEKIELENTALRAKLNPHFLFNVLESFRIESEKILPGLSRSIGYLIHIIRSSITDSGPDGMIPLKREVKAIESYISIFKRRYPENHISYSAQILGKDEYRILPHILLEFVENAFKHGDYKDPNKKISIRLRVNDNDLHFQVSNKKRGNIESKRNMGIGLNNIKKHLHNGYKENHELLIQDTKENFQVDLKVKALKKETSETLKSNIHD